MNTNDKKHEIDDDKINESEPANGAITYINNNLSEEDKNEIIENLQSDKPVFVNTEGRGEVHHLEDLPAVSVDGNGNMTNLETGDPIDMGGNLPDDVSTRVIHSVPVSEPDAKTIDEVKEIMEGWKEETKIPESEKKEVKPYCMVDPKDVEKHGFKLQPRGKSTDPFTYRKWFVILETPGQLYSWEEEGYCLQLTMLMPDGRTFINVLGPEHVYFPDKCDMSICPCHFDGIVRTSEEMDAVIDMTIKRNACFVFDPKEEVPHQNFWVELARNQVNAKPVKN